MAAGTLLCLSGGAPAARDPPLDQEIRDRDPRRDYQALASARERGTDFLTAEPPHVFQLSIVWRGLAALGMRLETQHHRQRERPWLRGDEARVLNGYARLLPDLAYDRFLDRLARSDKSREYRVLPCRPTGLAAQ